MFRNKSAWFSDSVKRDIVNFWVSQGGAICDWEKADYLISEDASCPDTHRLRWSTKSVPLGHYLLPPVSVQREVKARLGRFIWEKEEMLGVSKTARGNRNSEQILYIQPDAKRSESENGKKRQENCMNTSLSEESVCCKAQLYPVNNMLSGYVHIDQLKKFSGELCDFLPSHFGYSVSRSHSRRPYQ
ncbi:telomere repeats-binding bouquet formation protein 2 isoform X3 [Silurus meridionalis]|uniref:telomere repeats-binding bouquet formation protein 2 isoform X3 n=1 Tax=Silurus meridionalis TaxID=175797 RepID=UPI001EECDF9D|nr:telomere repeats-binding bouquet formation protein 2 isoform X3 [Silurus meridionalis]